MTISLTQHHQEFIRSKVDAGEFESADQVVQIALCMLEARSARYGVTSKQDASRMIDEGAASLDRGEYVTPDQVNERIRALGEAWRAAAE